MIDFILSAIKIIFLLGFLILIHEAGHFFVAKFFKVRVNEFSIGFGPKIWKKQGKETKYSLRLIPLGGYVNMEGETEVSEDKNAFNKKPIIQRILIVVAGGMINIIFGVLVYFLLISFGANFIGTTITKNNMTNINLLAGDKIVKVNNKKVYFEADIIEKTKNSNGDEILLTINRNEEVFDIKVLPKEKNDKLIGIYFSGNDLSTTISNVVPNGPAYNQGIKAGDIILEVNGIDMNNNPYTVMESINSDEDNKILMKVKRNEEIIEKEINFEIVKSYFLDFEYELIEKTFFNQIYYSFIETGNILKDTINGIKLLFTGNVEIQQLVGPIGISEIVNDTQSFSEYVYIFAIISLSLGITNLLPFPPLDGGKIVILIIEGIRKKPIKENLEIKIQLFGFVILILLSIIIGYNDIIKVFK